MKKSVVMSVSAVLCAVLLGGCESAEPGTDQGDDRPEVIVGSDIYPPFNYMDEDGDPTGIDVDLATEAFNRMGYRAVFVGIDWEEKEQLLKEGSVDCIWGCFSMSGREDRFRWAGPYMVSRQVVAVNRESDIYRLSDLAGKVVAVQSTTKPEGIFLEHKGNIPEVGYVYSLEDRELIYTALGEGYVDAISAHETAIDQYRKDYGADFRILDEEILTTGLGVAFDRDDDRQIAERLSQTLEEMRLDGTSEEIVGHYLPDAKKYLEVERIED